MHPDIVRNIDHFLASDMVYLNPLGKKKCWVTFREEGGGGRLNICEKGSEQYFRTNENDSLCYKQFNSHTN